MLSVKNIVYTRSKVYSIAGQFREILLQNISHFFKVRIDDLLERDLSQVEKTKSKDIEGNDLRILPIVVNEEQEEKISLVPVKAAAGYLDGFSDPRSCLKTNGN